MRASRWHTSALPFQKTLKLAEALEISETMASVLARRGYDDPSEAQRFLSSEGELHDPFLFPEMDNVCKRLKQAVASGERICIYGDYDVDGITSTALLVDVLGRLGADVSYHLPNRFSEGYGVSRQAIDEIAAGGASLLVTVDCGISAKEELDLALNLGLEAIVIDHHRPVDGSLPSARIISPLLCDYPFKELAGVGLAFKVAQGLLTGRDGHERDLPDELIRHLDLVALGTVADVVPLIDENRSLVKRGLTQMTRSCRPGLKALMDIAQIDPVKLNAGLISFRLAPRINAAGRIEDPELAFQLLMADDGPTATELAAHLDALNRERQRIENKMLADAQEIVNGWPESLRSARGYVLSSPGWHEGVLGIVASKMAELHYRPVFMIAEGESLGKGSGRTIPAFDLHQALKSLGNLLASFGGHRAACGLTIEKGLIDKFRNEFSALTNKTISDKDFQPRHYVDALVTGQELTLGLAQELSQLEPFGMGNPPVELLATGVQIKRGRKTRDGQHFQCQISCGGSTSSAIGFRQAYLFDKIENHPEWDVVFRLEENEFNGSVSPQLNLKGLMPRVNEPEKLPGACTSRCDYDCQDRVSGAEFWQLVTDYQPQSLNSLEGLARSLEERGCPNPPDIESRVIDRRGYGGIPIQIAKLATTGQNILMLVADVPRRRHLVANDLPIANLEVEQVFTIGARCGEKVIADRIDRLKTGPVVVLTDYVTALTSPDLTVYFSHLVLVDPPPKKSLISALAAAAPEAMLHLFYCSDEVQFTGKVLEHEFDLRVPLAKVYRQLKAGKTHPFTETTERLLLAGGKYLRQPILLARCLKVLEELSLVVVEERDGIPILILPESGKTELERSPTFQSVNIFYRECQKFLNKSLDVKPI